MGLGWSQGSYGHRKKWGCARETVELGSMRLGEDLPTSLHAQPLPASSIPRCTSAKSTVRNNPFLSLLGDYSLLSLYEPRASQESRQPGGRLDGQNVFSAFCVWNLGSTKPSSVEAKEASPSVGTRMAGVGGGGGGRERFSPSISTELVCVLT